MAPEGAAGSRRERRSDVEVLHRGSIEMLESFNALCDYRPTRKQNDVRGRRLALGTTALRSPPLHPEDRLKHKSLDLLIKRARVLRRSGVIDGSQVWLCATKTIERYRFSLDAVLLQYEALLLRKDFTNGNQIPEYE